MLNPQSAPKIYRQNDTWHVRIYVPKPVVHLVGAKELHRSTKETNRAAALKAAEKIRAKLYAWFNGLQERDTQVSRRVTELTDAEIANMAHKVYHNYREEVVSEMAYFFQLSSKQQEANSIPEDDRSTVLYSLLSDFDLPDAANVNAQLMLKQRGLTLAPDTPTYTKLLRRIREALTQVHVDAVNLLANTPAKGDNPFFIDPVTQEPKVPLSAIQTTQRSEATLDVLIPMVLNEVRVTRGPKGYAKMAHTLKLLSEFFGQSANISSIDRQRVISFRQALENSPSNATKRYPNMTILQVMDARSPNHENISISHLNGHLQNLRQFFKTCARNDSSLIVPNLEKLDLYDPVDALDKRFPFSSEQLEALFTKAISKQVGDETPIMFWICALGLFHGLRANEIASLRTSDITQEFDTTCIDLKLPKELLEGVRRGKSKTVPRKLPMHPTLIALGFPEFVARQSSGRIFHQLPRSSDGYYSRKISDWGTTSVDALGWKGQKLSYHSFRHTFLDALDDAGLPEKWKSYLGGWRLKDVMNKTYGSKEMKETIVPAIGKVQYKGLSMTLIRLLKENE
jgi:integrase